MEKRKVGILTFHRQLNYGAALQAVATYHMFKSLGCEPYIIDYRHERTEESRKLIFRNCQNEKRIIKKLKIILHNIYHYRTEHKRSKRFDEFIKSNALLTKPCHSDEELRSVSCSMDILVTGSDLVWNWDIDTDMNPVFFLNFAHSFKGVKLSYASSMGTAFVPDKYKPLYKSYLQNFDFISLREKTALKLLQPLSEKEISCVLDPTLMVDAKDWHKMEIKVKTPAKYAFFYILEFTEEVKKIIEYVNFMTELPIVFFTLRSHYGRRGMNMYEYGPGEFLYLLNNAEFIVTNSFHGTVFSILYNKNFYTIPHSTRGSRMTDLAEKLKQEKRVVYTLDEFKKSFSLQYETKDCNNENIESYRDESLKYLKNIFESQAMKYGKQQK